MKLSKASEQLRLSIFCAFGTKKYLQSAFGGSNFIVSLQPDKKPRWRNW